MPTSRLPSDPAGQTFRRRRRRPRRAGWLLAATALLAAGWGGCRGAGGDAAVDYADAVFDPGPDGALPAGLRFYTCGEESHMARLVEAPLRLSAAVEGRTELVVTACRRSRDGDRSGRLVLRVGSPGGEVRELSYPLEHAWRTERFDLGARGGETLVVELVREGGGTAGVAVRDFALRSERDLERPRPQAPRALLISLDTFRADAAAALGGNAVTPALDALAAQAERFEPHWAAEISTKPSHASLLTGLPVAVHGCDREEVPLADGFTTLAERLRERGVATGGFANQAVLLAARYGFAQGFDLYRNERWSSSALLRAATRWLVAHGDRPAFAFVHLYAAHSDGRHWPYESDAVAPRRLAAAFGLPDYGCRGGLCGSRLLLALGHDPRVRALPREPELVRALYDAGVGALDRDLGTFFADLRRAGLWDDTLVVVTADHGEAFAEHGRFLHVTAHEEVLRVPLLVKWPNGRRAGATTERPSTGLDVAPTLLGHFGVAAPDLVGEDLAQPPRSRRAALTSLHAVRLDRWKLLLPTPEHPGGLYDLVADPGEHRDLLAAHPVEAERLRALHAGVERLARERTGAVGAAAPVPRSPEELEQLRALGYLK